MERVELHGILVLILCIITTRAMECPAAEREALLEFKRVLHPNSSAKLFSWNGTNCCVWYGIRCDNITGSVTYVSVHYVGLQNTNGLSIWPSLSKLKSLQLLDLSHNNFTGLLPNSIGTFHRLTILDLSFNYFQGPIPSSIGNLHNLTMLYMDSNKLNGSVPNSLGRLSRLLHLYLSHNHFSGVISESLFSNLTKLKDLVLAGNPVVFNPIPNWVPPFQISRLDMSSCNVGGSFPDWIRSRKNINQLSLSDCNISGSIPNWLWNMSFLGDLDLAFNHLYGQLPNLNNNVFMSLDLSSNLLGGRIPHFNESIQNLVLSNNRLSGPIPTNIGSMMPNLFLLALSNNDLTGQVPISLGNIILSYLDLSRNNLAGRISSIFGYNPFLLVLDLQRNNFSGEIPKSLGMLSYLEKLCLGNNKLSGIIPPSLQNLSGLKILDLGGNNLSGNIPSWVGEVFPNLEILSLRSNSLSGELPLHYSNMTSLQILDLSENKLNGTIPASFTGLEAMAQLQHKSDGYGRVFYLDDTYDQVEFGLNVHDMQITYTKTLYLVTSIDLSGNNLCGEIPEEITRLVGLVALNLSGNHITGHIPRSISKLQQLLSLDLSSNNLSGSIPAAMSEMTFLQTLDLSYNNLTGRIPDGNQMMTFNKSSFSGNPGLCGEPIDVKCGLEDDTRNGRQIEEEKEDEEDRGYMSIGLGFCVGLVGPYVVFSVKRSWGGFYFAFVDFVVFKLSCGICKAARTKRRRNW